MIAILYHGVLYFPRYDMLLGFTRRGFHEISRSRHTTVKTLQIIFGRQLSNTFIDNMSHALPAWGLALISFDFSVSSGKYRAF